MGDLKEAGSINDEDIVMVKFLQGENIFFKDTGSDFGKLPLMTVTSELLDFHDEMGLIFVFIKKVASSEPDFDPEINGIDPPDSSLDDLPREISMNFSDPLQNFSLDFYSSSDEKEEK